jgi:hypothetical protein
VLVLILPIFWLLVAAVVVAPVLVVEQVEEDFA